MKKVSGIIINEVCVYVDLYDYIQDAYRVLYISYQNLFIEKTKNKYSKPINAKKWPLEDTITDDLIRNEEFLPKQLNYRIVNQQKDASKNTRIDIAIQWSLKFGHSYDIKIECKLLNKNNLPYIINSGIGKFKTNVYAEKLPLSGMLAFNTSETIQNNIKSLNTLIERKLSSKEILTEYSILADYQYTYKSNHKRNDNTDFDLYSCVFEFNEVIEN